MDSLAGVTVVEHCAGHPVVVHARAEGYQYDILNQVVLGADAPYTRTLKRARPVTLKVVDRDSGEPVAGAHVKLFQSEGYPCEHADPYNTVDFGTTDAEGALVLRRLTDGCQYWFAVETEDGRRALVPKLTTAQSSVTAHLGPALYVKGTVTGALETLETQMDKPVIRYDNPIVIDCGERGTNRHHHQKTLPVDVQNGEASFRIDGLWEGELTIEAGPKKVRLNVRQPIESTVINIGETSSRTVVLRFMTGKPGLVPKGVVTVMTRTADGRGTQRPMTLDENGEVHFDVQTPGSYECKSKRIDGYRFEEVVNSPVPAGSEPLTREIALLPAGCIHGRVEMPDGFRVSGYVHLVYGPENLMRGPKAVQVGSRRIEFAADNSFITESLHLDCTYEIEVQSGSTILLSEPIELTAVEPVHELVLKAERAVAVEGVVLDPDGKPLPNVLLQLEAIWKSGRNGRTHTVPNTRTDAEGCFSFGKVNPDIKAKYCVRIWPRQDFRPVQKKARLDGKPLTFRLERGCVIEGVVLDHKTKEPIPGAMLMARAEPGLFGKKWPSNVEAEAPTDRDGRFRFSNLSEGVYRLTSPVGGVTTEFVYDTSKTAEIRDVTLHGTLRDNPGQ